jgi:hypothetical protein
MRTRKTLRLRYTRCLTPFKLEHYAKPHKYCAGFVAAGPNALGNNGAGLWRAEHTQTAFVYTLKKLEGGGLCGRGQ